MNHFPIEAILCLLLSWIAVYKKTQICKELKNNSTKFMAQDITIIVPSWSYDSWIYNYPIVQTQYPRSFQGKYRQFADCRDDSTRIMIVDKFYHFHHHRGSVAHNEQMYFINLRVQSISVV